MRKLLITLVILLFCFPAFAQDEVTWLRDGELEGFFYEWDVEVEVWKGFWDDGFLSVNIEDVWSEDWFDVRSQLSTVLYSIYDEAVWMEQTPDDLDFDLIIYSWFEYDDPFDPGVRYENEDLVWDIYIDKQWLKRYFAARRDRDRTSMVSMLVDSLVAQWEEVNRDLIKRDIQPFNETIIEQQQIEDMYEAPGNKK